MTQAQIDKINKLNKEQKKVEDEIAKLKEKALAIWKKRFNITNACDHMYPDGSPAWDAIWYVSECKICNKVG